MYDTTYINIAFTIPMYVRYTNCTFFLSKYTKIKDQIYISTSEKIMILMIHENK